MMKKIDSPMNVLPLMQKLDSMLIALLRTLTPVDWNKNTIARRWLVKDIASHLLDGNLRGISVFRDGHLPAVSSINSYSDLVSYLNELNSTWVNATRRLSPAVIIELLEFTEKEYINTLASLDMFAESKFSVAWAGEETSLNWFHIAREYTEKYIHQQQIRHALNDDSLLTREFFYPFIHIFMHALPHTYLNVDAAENTTIHVKVTEAIGGDWYLTRTDNQWKLSTDVPGNSPVAILSIDPSTAWKLFSKGISPQEALSHVKIEGDAQLAKVALGMVSVMA